MKKSCGVSTNGYFIRYGAITVSDKDALKCFQIFWDKVWRMAGENFITVETLQCEDFKEVVERYKTYFLQEGVKNDRVSKATAKSQS